MRLPEAAVDRRSDRRVAELHLRVVDGRLLGDELRLRAFDRRAVGLDGRGDRVGAGARLFGDVLRDDAGLGELGLALRGELRSTRRSTPSRTSWASAWLSNAWSRSEVGLGLLERGLERPLVDREEQLVFLDEVAFAERAIESSWPVICERTEIVVYASTLPMAAMSTGTSRSATLVVTTGTAPPSPRPRPPRPPPPPERRLNPNSRLPRWR